MTLAVIVPVSNRHDITGTFLRHILNATKRPIELVFIDNGSLEPLTLQKLQAEASTAQKSLLQHKVSIVRNEQNTGVWPTFYQGLDNSSASVVAYLHNDLYVYDDGWDEKILQAFENDEKLGLIGFVGSYEQDRDGGRGLGTMSNFQGRDGVGSPAEAHGRRITDLRSAFVVDGCSMIFRRDYLQHALYADAEVKILLNEFGPIKDFPPHHFYDRLLSLLMHILGYRTAVYGIACDHVSGQTANTQDSWHKTAEEWCLAHRVHFSENWDHSIYLEAEKRFLELLYVVMDTRRKWVVAADYTKNLI